MNIEQAKRLLKKGKELGDSDLIEMALEVLETEAKVEVETPKKRGHPKKTPKLDSKIAKTTRKETESPILLKGKPNKFVDNLTECNGPDDKTPEFVPAERVRPRFTKKIVKCSQCSAIVEEHPMFVSEFYRCNACKGKK